MEYVWHLLHLLDLAHKYGENLLGSWYPLTMAASTLLTIVAVGWLVIFLAEQIVRLKNAASRLIRMIWRGCLKATVVLCDSLSRRASAKLAIGETV